MEDDHTNTQEGDSLHEIHHPSISEENNFTEVENNDREEDEGGARVAHGWNGEDSGPSYAVSDGDEARGEWTESENLNTQEEGNVGGNHNSDRQDSSVGTSLYVTNLSFKVRLQQMVSLHNFSGIVM